MILVALDLELLPYGDFPTADEQPPINVISNLPRTVDTHQAT